MKQIAMKSGDVNLIGELVMLWILRPETYANAKDLEVPMPMCSHSGAVRRVRRSPSEFQIEPDNYLHARQLPTPSGMTTLQRIYGGCITPLRTQRLLSKRWAAGVGRLTEFNHCQSPHFESLAVNAGTNCITSATTSTSAISPIGASLSLLIATMKSDFFMPAKCWIAPLIPQAT